MGTWVTPIVSIIHYLLWFIALDRNMDLWLLMNGENEPCYWLKKNDVLPRKPLEFFVIELVTFSESVLRDFESRTLKSFRSYMVLLQNQEKFTMSVCFTQLRPEMRIPRSRKTMQLIRAKIKNNMYNSAWLER